MKRDASDDGDACLQVQKKIRISEAEDTPNRMTLLRFAWEQNATNVTVDVGDVADAALFKSNIQSLVNIVCPATSGVDLDTRKANLLRFLSSPELRMLPYPSTLVDGSRFEMVQSVRGCFECFGRMGKLCLCLHIQLLQHRLGSGKIGVEMMRISNMRYSDW